MPQGSSESQNPNSSAAVPRNVSFANDSNESTAYREHNPPTVLRRQVAARKETPTAQDVQSSTPEEQRELVVPDLGGSLKVAPNADRNSGNSAGLATGFSDKHVSATQLSPITTGLRPTTSNSSSQLPSRTEHRSVSVDSKAGTKKNAASQKTVLAGSSSNPASAKMRSSSFVDANKQDEVHILVAVSGSVATIKLPQIVHKLKQIYRKRAVIQVVVTRAATTFFDPSDLPRDIKVWHDSDEWRSRQATEGPEFGAHSDQQLHIRLRRWADILLVAPCSANTLAKLTYGICDNLLTSIFRVWNPNVPILLAPAMNTHMYTNPVTKRHFNIIKESYPFVEILKPVEKVLVCGDIGMGGMREWTDIVQILVKRVGAGLEEEDEEEEDEDEDQQEDDGENHNEQQYRKK